MIYKGNHKPVLLNFSSAFGKELMGEDPTTVILDLLMAIWILLDLANQFAGAGLLRPEVGRVLQFSWKGFSAVFVNCAWEFAMTSQGGLAGAPNFLSYLRRSASQHHTGRAYSPLLRL